jgi:hypothetical protein
MAPAFLIGGKGNSQVRCSASIGSHLNQPPMIIIPISITALSTPNHIKDFTIVPGVSWSEPAMLFTRHNQAEP